MKPLTAIKRYFDTDSRKVTSTEMKQLTREDRMELGQLACEQLGEPFEEPQEAGSA